MVLLMSARAADTITPNLQALTSEQGVKFYRITTEWSADEGGKPALKLRTTPGEDGLVVLGGITFTNGVIEFDARGKSGPPQSNFIGIAIRVVDGTHYDNVYFRPFNFRTTIEERRIHAVQYASQPKWPWPRLRSERTGQFEKPIEPPPDGDAWFHAKIVVQKPKVSVFVDGAKEPSLVVSELTDRTAGSVALWCNGFGAIANLKITPTGSNQ